MAKSKTKKLKEWVWSGNPRSRHGRLAGERVELFHAFSNGLQYPGDHNGPPKEWEGCQCSLRIVTVQKNNAEILFEEKLLQGEIKEYLTNIARPVKNVVDQELEQAIKYLDGDQGVALNRLLKNEFDLEQSEINIVKKLDESIAPIKEEQKVYLPVHSFEKVFGQSLDVAKASLKNTVIRSKEYLSPSERRDLAERWLEDQPFHADNAVIEVDLPPGAQVIRLPDGAGGFRTILPRDSNLYVETIDRQVQPVVVHVKLVERATVESTKAAQDLVKPQIPGIPNLPEPPEVDPNFWEKIDAQMPQYDARLAKEADEELSLQPNTLKQSLLRSGDVDVHSPDNLEMHARYRKIVAEGEYPEELKAEVHEPLSLYAGTDLHADINAILVNADRAGKTPVQFVTDILKDVEKLPESEQYDALYEAGLPGNVEDARYFSAQAQNLLNLYTKIPGLKRDMYAWTGMSVSEDLQVGSVIESSGVTSTSIDGIYARGFARAERETDQPALLRMVLKKGDKVLQVDGNIVTEVGIDEGEFILPPHTKMTVLRQVGVSEGTPVFDVELEFPEIKALPDATEVARPTSLPTRMDNLKVGDHVMKQDREVVITRIDPNGMVHFQNTDGLHLSGATLNGAGLTPVPEVTTTTEVLTTPTTTLQVGQEVDYLGDRAVITEIRSDGRVTAHLIDNPNVSSTGPAGIFKPIEPTAPESTPTLTEVKVGDTVDYQGEQWKVVTESKKGNLQLQNAEGKQLWAKPEDVKVTSSPVTGTPTPPPPVEIDRNGAYQALRDLKANSEPWSENPAGQELAQYALGNMTQGTGRAFVLRSETGDFEGVINLTEKAKPEGETSVYVEYLASIQPGGGTKLMVEAAKVAAEEGKGLYLVGEYDALGFYRKLGMKELDIQKWGSDFYWSPEEVQAWAEGRVVRGGDGIWHTIPAPTETATEVIVSEPSPILKLSKAPKVTAPKKQVFDFEKEFPGGFTPPKGVDWASTQAHKNLQALARKTLQLNQDLGSYDLTNGVYNYEKLNSVWDEAEALDKWLRAYTSEDSFMQRTVRDYAKTLNLDGKFARAKAVVKAARGVPTAQFIPGEPIALQGPDIVKAIDDLRAVKDLWAENPEGYRYADVGLENALTGDSRIWVIRDEQGRVVATQDWNIRKVPWEDAAHWLYGERIGSITPGGGTKMFVQMAKEAAKKDRGVFFEGEPAAKPFFQKLGLHIQGPASNGRDYYYWTPEEARAWSEGRIAKGTDGFWHIINEGVAKSLSIPDPSASVASSDATSEKIAEKAFGLMQDLEQVMPKQWTEGDGLSIYQVDLQEGFDGYFSQPDRVIALRQGNSEAEQIHTLIHETGHALDYEWGGGPDNLTSFILTDPGASEFLRTALSSDRLMTLQRDRVKVREAINKIIENPTPEGYQKLDIYMQVESDLSYLLDAKEVWARAYAQYVAEETGDTTLLENIRARSLDISADQWTESDFTATKIAVQNLLKRQGVLSGDPIQLNIEVPTFPQLPDLAIANETMVDEFLAEGKYDPEAALANRSDDQLKALLKGIMKLEGEAHDATRFRAWQVIEDELKRRGVNA